MTFPFLSIVIPAYNEARRLPGTLEQLGAFCEVHPGEVEVLVVVEKSSDGTLDLARKSAEGRVCWKVIANDDHRGKGYAVRCGMLQARGDLLFFMDADLSVPLEEIVAFARFLQENPGVDLLFGSRKHPESRIIRRQSRLREQMGEAFNAVVRRLAGIGIRDTQCGFKAFRRAAAQAIFSRQELDGFAFDVEICLLAQRLGLQVEERPLEWRDEPDSRVQIVRDSFRMLCDVVAIKRRFSRLP